MGPRIVWRRSATAVGIYGSAFLGILATVVAARELTKLDFSRFALVFALTGLLQLFLDLTVEEVVVKFGNRYIARSDWPRFHRLLRLSLAVKLGGGALGAAAVVVASFVASWMWSIGGVRGALLVAALLPLVQAAEGVGYAVLLLRNRYDVRGGLLLFSMALRLAAVAIGASIGLVATFVAIVIAQCISTGTISAVALAVVRRYHTPSRRASAKTGVRSSRSPFSRAWPRASPRCVACCRRCSSALSRSRCRSRTFASRRRRRPRSRRSPRPCGSCSSPSRLVTSSTDAATGPSSSFAAT